MPKYVLAYHGAHNFVTKEAGAAHMAAWNAWVAGLGSANVDPGLPVGPSKTLSKGKVSDGGGANPICGISIIQAASMDEAVRLANGCPHLNIGGTIEVAEALNMPM